ncbi:MAG: radical SAM family heme chaperone HemW, partial [Rhodocyclaceae bacterium]|nr:radical SAM family heme chaperone HemW [Rhodocyclaceae bacterium]
MIPLSLYIHFPWCVQKCPYCDFNSHEIKGNWAEADYLAALRADFAAMQPVIEGRNFHSVFFGGGSPSLMQASSVEALLSDVPLMENAEITLEANPGAIEADKFAAFREAGINRLSIGIQSFNDTQLAALGRIHSARDAMRAVDLAQRYFKRVNLDLMTGLPGQTLADARRDIESAIALAPGHLSVYALTLEPGTPFHRTPPPLPDEDLAADMQEMAEEMLLIAGYEHYE